jgi:hypothetical protein
LTVIFSFGAGKRLGFVNPKRAFGSIFDLLSPAQVVMSNSGFEKICHPAVCPNVETVIFDKPAMSAVFQDFHRQIRDPGEPVQVICAYNRIPVQILLHIGKFGMTAHKKSVISVSVLKRHFFRK